MVDGRRPVRYDVALALEELASADPKLGRLIAAAGPYMLRLKSSHSPFEALLESIIYQQLHGKAAAAILGRLLTLFGEIHPAPEHVLAMPAERMRAAGVSQGKILAIRDLAAKTIDGTVPTLARIRRMTDDEIVEHLTQVRGIGPWTVEMLLMFRLGRPDVLPVSDYGVRKGFALTYRGFRGRSHSQTTCCRSRRRCCVAESGGGRGVRWRVGICGGPVTSREGLRRRRSEAQVSPP